VVCDIRNDVYSAARSLTMLRRIVVACALVIAALPMSARGQATRYYEQTYMHASHNWVFRSTYPQTDHLFNAFDYGHAILYETLWRHPNAPREALDDKQFGFITTDLLVHPPSVMLDESAIGPEWAKLAPEVLMMFDWAHMLHRQIYDVWADERIKPADKDAAVAKVVAYYKSRGDIAFSSRPKDMSLMEGQPYSLAFRKRFPKYNGLIWSYHWMQMALYEALMAGNTRSERKQNVAAVTARFWQMVHNPASLPKMMPLSPAIAPRFSARYPEAAVIFDNLHSMHDVVSDILANPSVPRSEKRAAILAAAARYRDDHTNVTTIEDWRSMARDMGAGDMGGDAPVPASSRQDSTGHPAKR
jgi:hypothetical protein